jgi:hypothetical protein
MEHAIFTSENSTSYSINTSFDCFSQSFNNPSSYQDELANQYTYHQYDLQPSFFTCTNGSHFSISQNVIKNCETASNFHNHSKKIIELNVASTSPQSEQMVVTSKPSRRPKLHQLSEKAVKILNDWFMSHINHPYPTAEEKLKLSEKCGIKTKQLNSWFCNRRNRSQNTKPKRIKKKLEQEISNVFNELLTNPNNIKVIQNFRSTFNMFNV